MADQGACSHYSFCPDWRRFNRIRGTRPGVFASASGKSTDGANRHVLIANNLATKPQAGLLRQALYGENFLFGFGHFIRLTRNKLNPACCAPGMAAARM